MTGSTTSICRDAIPAHGLQLELVWDAALLKKLPVQGRPEIEAPLCLQIRLSLAGERVIMEGTGEARAVVVCDRCLERFSYPLSLSFRSVFQPVGMQDSSRNVQLGPGDMDIVYYDGECIDLVEPVFEQIYLGLPAYPHCSNECEGLCPQCGANLNKGACGCETVPRPQSPFAKLAELKKKA